MPLRSEQALEIVTLILVVWMCALGAACIIYVFRFRAKIQGNGRGSVNLRHLRDFNSPWLLRFTLSVVGCLWVLLELLRLPLVRRRGWLLHGIGAQGQRNLCRGYVVGSLGFAEPAFFLTALFLIRESICEDPFSFSRRRWKLASIFRVLGLALPVFLLQMFFVVITPIFEFRRGYILQKEGYHGIIPKPFTQAFVMERTSTGRELAVCRIPLLSTVTMAVFSIGYIIYFLYLGWKMVLLVINRRLQIRVYGLVSAVVVLVPLHLLLLGLSSSALSGFKDSDIEHTKHKAAHQVVPFLRFITIAAIVGVGKWVLVMRPIADAMSVLRVSMGSVKTGRLDSWGAIPTDRFSSLPMFDEDRTSLVTERSVELMAADLEADVSVKNFDEVV